MFCNKCGKKLNKSDMFCSKCGSKRKIYIIKEKEFINQQYNKLSFFLVLITLFGALSLTIAISLISKNII